MQNSLMTLKVTVHLGDAGSLADCDWPLIFIDTSTTTAITNYYQRTEFGKESAFDWDSSGLAVARSVGPLLTVLSAPDEE